MESLTSERRLKRLERMRQAWEYRKAGKTTVEIARLLCVCQKTASEDILAMFAEYRQQFESEASEAARLDLARLDALLDSQWTNAMSGDTKAAMVVLKILERRAKLLGLDAPATVAVQGPTMTADEAKRLLRERGVEVD